VVTDSLAVVWMTPLPRRRLESVPRARARARARQIILTATECRRLGNLFRMVLDAAHGYSNARTARRQRVRLDTVRR
jgi:hypothetical protein